MDLQQLASIMLLFWMDAIPATILLISSSAGGPTDLGLRLENTDNPTPKLRRGSLAGEQDHDTPTEYIERWPMHRGSLDLAWDGVLRVIAESFTLTLFSLLPIYFGKFR